MGRLRNWRWQRRVRRVMRRDHAWTNCVRRFARVSHSMPDPVLLRRAGEITDLRERRLAYEAAAQSRPADTPRGSRRYAGKSPGTGSAREPCGRTRPSSI